jgi:hypothetical protein
MAGRYYDVEKSVPYIFRPEDGSNNLPLNVGICYQATCDVAEDRNLRSDAIETSYHTQPVISLPLNTMHTLLTYPCC